MPTTVFTRRLESIAILSAEEKQAIKDLPVHAMNIRADQDIVREGDRPTRACFIIEGVTCAYKIAADSRRQIVGFYLPGDAPDFQSIHLPLLDISIATLTPSMIGFIQHIHVRELCVRMPGVATALWRQTLIDAAVFREWMTSIGQRPARARISHLLCEIYVRSRAVGLAKGTKIAFPITQLEMGDALGISTVHVNRSVQYLRRNRLIALSNGTLQILDWPGLQRIADFSPDYLNLTHSSPPA
jgi:CRP-like cAMP-binding protein